MTGDEGFDIAIVGGGLIGAGLACALTPLQLKTVLIESVDFSARNQPSYDEKMLSLSLGSKRILEAMNLWPRIGVEAAPVEMVHISDRGYPGKTRLYASEFGVPALGYITPARTIGQALVSSLSETAAVSIRCPAKVTALSQHPDRVQLQLEDGEILSAKLVVLADGGASQTRGMVGVEAKEKRYGQTAVLSTVTPDQPRDNVAFERFTESGPLALLPSRGGRCAVVWTTRDANLDELLNLTDDQYIDGLQQRFGDYLGGLRDPAPRKPYPLKLISVDRVTSHRALIVGNAAHTLHPVAGQGFNLGLRDVATLADVLGDAQGEGVDIGLARVLERYSQVRRRDVRNTSLFTDGLISVFANESPALVALRNLGLAALNRSPHAQRFLVRRTAGLSGRLSRLARGLKLH